MTYFLVVIVTLFFSTVVYGLDRRSFQKKILEKSMYRGTIFVKDEPFVVLKEEDYHMILYRTWADQNAISQELRKVLADVVRERMRQDIIYPEPPASVEELLVVLVEEIGEFAQAVQAEKTWSKTTDCDNTYEEIIQSGAVCLKIAEYLLKRDCQ